MPDYRLYCLDGAGPISLADWVTAETDEEAIAKAREWDHGALKCEIWPGRRLVKTLNTDALAKPEQLPLLPPIEWVRAGQQ